MAKIFSFVAVVIIFCAVTVSANFFNGLNAVYNTLMKSNGQDLEKQLSRDQKDVLEAIILRGTNNYEGSSPNKPSTIDKGCMIKKCGKETLKALTNFQFLEMTKCELGCSHLWDDDESVEKYQYQNCTITCAKTYENDVGDEYLACMMVNECMKFGKIDVQCPDKEFKQALHPTGSLAVMTGEWWQGYGRNDLFDCYPCQHLHKMELSNDPEFCAQTINSVTKEPLSAPCWSYTYSYDVYINKPPYLSKIKQTWALPGDIPEGEAADIYYEYLGTLHDETWYILDYEPDRFVALGVCSYMQGWTNVGAIVWVRPPTVDDQGVAVPELNDDELSRISVAFDKVGIEKWSFPEDFCADKHGPESCPGNAEVMMNVEQVQSLNGDRDGILWIE